MEFLQLIETFRAEDASHDRMFAADGLPVSAIRQHPQYNRMLSEALTVVQRARGSRYGFLRFQEAMGTADFPLIMGDVLQRQALGYYQEAPYTWRNYCRRGVVPDFRAVKRFAADGAEGVLMGVSEKNPYKPAVLSETSYSYSVSKYGRTLNWSWEAWINDDLGLLGASSPDRLGKAARRSEEKFATGLFVGTTGPLSTLYTSGNKNIVTSNPALSISALQTAMQILGAMVDADGEPIAIETVELVVPPALEITAMNILNATELWLTAGGGASGYEVHVTNWMRQRTRLSVNYYIPIVASSSNGSTSWFLFASAAAGRPALEMGFLQGHETPELFQKIGDQQRIGGGVNPLDGDFDRDVVSFKVRHVFGGTALDPKATVASNGSGS